MRNDMVPVKEFSKEERFVQGIIFKVISRENRARLSLVAIPKDGIFTPFITFFEKHTFMTAILYYNRSIVMRMFEEISLIDLEDSRDFGTRMRELMNRIREANKSPVTKDRNKRWMYFLYNKKDSKLMVNAEVPIDPDSGEERITETFQEKFSDFIELVRMFYSGVFDQVHVKEKINLFEPMLLMPDESFQTTSNTKERVWNKERRLWLKIPWFWVHNIHDFLGESDDMRSFSMDVQLGEVLDVKGVIVAKNSDADMTLDWAMANPRLIDKTSLHRHVTKSPLLEDALVIAIMEEKRKELTMAFSTDFKGVEVACTRPRTWFGKSLRIPVDFIRLQNFNCSTGEGYVYADLVVGRHFIVCQAQIYNGFAFAFDPSKKKVISKELRFLAEELMKEPTLRQLVLNIFKDGPQARETDEKFTYILKHCDLNGIPPAIRFY